MKCPTCGLAPESNLCPDPCHREGEDRPLRLSWGKHERGGGPHIEWHAPCGCAYHPEPTPHVHPCREHGANDL